MNSKVLFSVILEHLTEVLEQKTSQAKSLWEQFINVHPADIAHWLSNLEPVQYQLIYTHLPRRLKIEVFKYLSESMRIEVLSIVDERDKVTLLNTAPTDELTDLFEELSDEELRDYLTLLNSHDRKKVLELMEYDPQTAAGIMDSDVLTFREDFTVEKAVHVLQRLAPRRELHQQIYVTNNQNQLIGFINLEDLVLKSSTLRLKAFMQKSEVVAQAHEDQESVAKKMIHYSQITVPVVGDNNVFLGVIPSDTLIDIIEKEASEDVYRMSAMSALTKGYFETSFYRLLYERGIILIILLMLQSFSTMITRYYEATLAGFLMFFMTMLTSTGGNSSSQTSALVIQGMASGEITPHNIWRFLKREMLMAFMLASILAVVSFLRVYITYGKLLGSFVVSVSLAAIVFFSVVLGSGIPIILKKMRIDPAFAAGPFLATIMDIFGLFLYCYISSFFF